MAVSRLVASAPAAVATTTATTAAAAVTTATTPVSTAAAPAPTAARRTGFAGPGFVYSQRPTFDGLTIELRDGRLSVRLSTHRDEGEAARLAGEFVLHERHFRDRAGL